MRKLMLVIVLCASALVAEAAEKKWIVESVATCGKGVKSSTTSPHHARAWEVTAPVKGGTYELRVQHQASGKPGAIRHAAWLDTDRDGIPDKLLKTSLPLMAAHPGEWTSWRFHFPGGRLFVGYSWKHEDEVSFYSGNRPTPKGWKGFGKIMFYTEILGGVPNLPSPGRYVNLHLDRVKTPRRERRILAKGKPRPKPKIAEKWQGFRGVKWGSHITELAGRVDAKGKIGSYKVYLRDGERLQIGNAQLEMIGFAYYKDRLGMVAITCKGSENSKALLLSMIAHYGRPSQPNEFIEKYQWVGPNVWIILEKGFGNETEVQMVYDPIHKQEQIDDAAAAIKAKDDF